MRSKGRGRGGRFNSRPYCQICQTPGHTEQKCYHRFDQKYQNSSYNTSVYYSSPDITANPDWLFDSGATNHVTSDSNNLINKSEFNGPDKLILENGQGLSIANTGSSIIHTESGKVILDKMFDSVNILKKKKKKKVNI